MARKPRFTHPGYCQHVVQRGLARQACFFSADDCRLYLALLEEAARQYGCHVHVYVLMTNHIHLLLTQQRESGVSFMMQVWSQRHVSILSDTRCCRGFPRTCAPRPPSGRREWF